MRRLWAAVLALLPAAPAAALDIALDARGLAPAQQAQARLLVEDTLARLPERWRADPRVLPLRFDPGLPAGIAGHHHRGRLSLSPRLLEDAPGAGLAPARAALVHEIAHALDRGGGRWSADPVFRRLAGWDRPGPTAWTLRLPDPQAARSPAEALAVHAEAHVLDPAHACRQPALAAWLAGALGPLPAPAADCPPGFPFLLATGDGPGLALEVIDPARVWAVDYLLAGSGGPPMSRFGHSMLRLVICAPGREPGPRCRMDLAHHRVLSFRAFVDDVQLSGWRGLTGGYPSRLFLLPLDQVIEDYTRVELRDLRAFPLALPPAARAAVLEAAAQAHWRYDGRYRFIGNNCAVETGRLLDTALAGRGGTIPALERTTPRGVLRALRRAGLLAADLPATELQGTAPAPPGPAATLDGLYFPSARAEYQHLLALLQTAGQVDPALSLERWLAAGPQRRGGIPAALPLEQAAAWLVLERAALRRAELRALDRLKRQLGRHAGLDAAVDGWRQWLGRLEAPGALPIGGHGIPQPAELERARMRLEGLEAEGRARWEQLRGQAEEVLDPASRVQLERTRGRVAALGRRVRELAAQ